MWTARCFFQTTASFSWTFVGNMIFRMRDTVSLYVSLQVADLVVEVPDFFFKSPKYGGLAFR